MPTRVTITDHTKLIEQVLEASAWEGVKVVAQIVKEEIRGRTPKESGGNPKRKPGTGARSYHYETDRANLTCYVTNRKRTYWLKYVEQGTKKMSARPHMVPGAEAARRRAEPALVGEMKRAI